MPEIALKTNSNRNRDGTVRALVRPLPSPQAIDMAETSEKSVTFRAALLQRVVSNHSRPSDLVPKQSHLVRRGHIFWFRMCIPAVLRAEIGHREFMFSLKTTDVTRAKRLASIETVKALAKLDA